jgi:hypothetical protein
MPIENERGVQSNWNLPLSVPSSAALPVNAPVGLIIRLEDTGASVQWSGTVWLAFAGGVGASTTITQPTWYISGTGSNSGDALTPATAINELERQRRWGALTVIDANVTVIYLDNAAGVSTFYNVQLSNTRILVIQGTPTVAKSGTFTAVTTLDRPTQVPWSVTEATLGAADVGKLIQISSGARSGNSARIVKDNGAGNVRTSPFGTLSIGTFAYPQVTPQAGDTFQVLDLTSIAVGSWHFASRGSGSIVGADYVQIDGLKLSGTNTVIEANDRAIYYGRTITAGIYFAGVAGTHFFAGGGADLGYVFPAITMYALGMGIMAQWRIRSGAFAFIDQDTIFQNALLQLDVGASVDGGLVSLFDRVANNNAILIDAGATYRSINIFVGANLLWGDANTGIAVIVRSTGNLAYNTKPTVNTLQGAGRQSVIGNTVTDWAGVPFINIANNAGIVQFV